MLRAGNILHFINRVDEGNCGDRVVCPLLHYYDYFSQYYIMRHDMRFIDYDRITSGDVVIIGGGGMFNYAEFTNRAINRVLDTGATVLAWAPGFNTHSEYCGMFQTEINFDRFASITVRDFQNSYGLDYLPDVTCKLQGLEKQYAVKRKFGIARHKDFPIKGLAFDTITNDQKLEDILRFIGESEVVISNSFHMIYWSLLMGKKTVCAEPFSTKFYSYQYKPAYYNPQTDKLQDCVDQARTYQILEECRAENDRFFELVKGMVEERLTPVQNRWYGYELVTQEAVQRERFRETLLQDGDMLASQLFVDTGSGFSESCKLVSINNVYGDDIHSVRFDLSAFDNICALRFDPIESRSCEVEIRSARTEAGDVVMQPQASVRVGVWDRFLSTDPQYYITALCADCLEIKFRLRAITLFEAEQNVYGYVSRQDEARRRLEEQLEQRNSQIAEQTLQLEQRDSWVGELTRHLGRLDMQVDDLTEKLSERDTRLGSMEMELAVRDARLGNMETDLEKRDAHISSLTDKIKARDAQLESLSEQLVQARECAAHQTELVQQLYHSRSWRLTAPLRALVNFFRTIRKDGGEHGNE